MFSPAVLTLKFGSAEASPVTVMVPALFLPTSAPALIDLASKASSSATPSPKAKSSSLNFSVGAASPALLAYVSKAISRFCIDKTPLFAPTIPPMFAVEIVAELLETEPTILS